MAFVLTIAPPSQRFRCCQRSRLVSHPIGCADLSWIHGCLCQQSFHPSLRSLLSVRSLCFLQGGLSLLCEHGGAVQKANALRGGGRRLSARAVKDVGLWRSSERS